MTGSFEDGPDSQQHIRNKWKLRGEQTGGKVILFSFRPRKRLISDCSGHCVLYRPTLAALLLPLGCSIRVCRFTIHRDFIGLICINAHLAISKNAAPRGLVRANVGTTVHSLGRFAPEMHPLVVPRAKDHR
jgi:hypothetical protein